MPAHDLYYADQVVGRKYRILRFDVNIYSVDGFSENGFSDQYTGTEGEVNSVAIRLLKRLPSTDELSRVASWEL